MKATLQPMHFTDNYLINPTNPVTINLIGAGSTGSRVLTTLAETHDALLAFGHPGLQVQLFDDDIITEPNLVKQRFAKSELGLQKAVARINNINRWYGTNWKAITKKFNRKNLPSFSDNVSANIFISCVDTVKARMEIAAIIKGLEKKFSYQRNRPIYWMDYGNSRFTGQVILSTIGKIEQPSSETFRAVAKLPAITDEFKELLLSSEAEDNTPSCSHHEAIEKQDLFINGALVQLGSGLLWNLFRDYMTPNRGVFLNLKTMRSEALRVG